eukprot:5535213-Amphidinium_carterae.2
MAAKAHKHRQNVLTCEHVDRELLCEVNVNAADAAIPTLFDHTSAFDKYRPTARNNQLQLGTMDWSVSG